MLPSFVHSQWGIDKYYLDELQLVEQEKQVYTFMISSIDIKQGLFFDNFDQLSQPKITVVFINDTKKVITCDSVTQDCGLQWISESKSDTLLPYHKVVYNAHYPDSAGYFSCPIGFGYEHNDSAHVWHFQAWGTLKPQHKRTFNQSKMSGEKETDFVPLKYKKRKRYAYYKEEIVNQYTRKKKRFGKWVYLHNDNSLNKILFYTLGKPTPDSTYIFYQSSNRLMRKEYTWTNDSLGIKKVSYNPSGTTVIVEYWNKQKEKYVLGKRVEIDRKYTDDDIPNRVLFYENGNVKQEFFKSGDVREYYSNGLVKKEKKSNRQYGINKVFHYYEDGLVKQIDRSPKNRGVGWHFLYKKDGDVVVEKQTRSFGKGQLISVEKGKFVKGDLWNGTKYYPTSPDMSPSSTKVIRFGKDAGYIYKGQIVNQLDSSGRKQGKWISVFRDVDTLHSISFYKDGIRIDSIISFYPSGKIRSTEYVKRRENGTTKIFFFQSGLVEKVEMLNEHKRYTVHFTEENQKWFFKKTYQIPYINTRRNDFEIPNTDRIDRYLDAVEEFYDRGTLYKRVYPKVAKIIYNVVPEGGGGAMKIPYKVEKGRFVDGVLWKGIIEYRDAQGKLQRTARVVNGVEQ